jgi:hypothetical protein
LPPLGKFGLTLDKPITDLHYGLLWGVE